MVKKILSIGTNKSMNYLLRTVIGNKYPLILVENVFQGMNLVKTRQDIKLIVIDIDSQTKESVDFIQHLGSSKLYNQHLVVISNSENQRINKSFIDSNVYASFIKPFNPMDLVHSIDDLWLFNSRLTAKL